MLNIFFRNILKQTESGEVILHIPKLRLKSQECTCCFGVDGSGKRTLLKILAGLIIPDMGDVEINNKSLLNNYSEVWEMLNCELLNYCTKQLFIILNSTSNKLVIHQIMKHIYQN